MGWIKRNDCPLAEITKNVVGKAFSVNDCSGLTIMSVFCLSETQQDSVMTKIYRQALFSKCDLYHENLNSEITVEINRSKTFSRSHRQPELLDNLSCSNQHK